jgi:hypothetical protein
MTGKNSKWLQWMPIITLTYTPDMKNPSGLSLELKQKKICHKPAEGIICTD